MIRISTWSGCVVLLVCTLFIGGCTGGDVSPMKNLVPVSGTVTFEGEPLEEGMVTFAPEDPGGQPAIGKISNGRFTMATTASSPGVIAGKYKVRIESNLDSGAGDLPPLKAGDVPVRPKSLIPAKYNDINTSGLQLEVSKGMAAPSWDLKP